MKLKCKKCNGSFETKSKTAKWCSSSCKLRAWREANPERFKKHQITYRNKEAKLCKGCGVELSRDRNHSHCTACAKANVYAATKRYKTKCREILHSIKVECGCLVCGWNKYGAALDFHHLENKKESITANTWMLPRVQTEYDKCVLVCKNCHYGIHHNEVILTDSMLKNRPLYRKMANRHIKDGKVI